jgi:hypothetical protein
MATPHLRSSPRRRRLRVNAPRSSARTTWKATFRSRSPSSPARSVSHRRPRRPPPRALPRAGRARAMWGVWAASHSQFARRKRTRSRARSSVPGSRTAGAFGFGCGGVTGRLYYPFFVRDVKRPDTRVGRDRPGRAAAQLPGGPGGGGARVGDHPHGQGRRLRPGRERVVRALDPLDPWGYGVATADEGAALRQLGVRRPIIVFGPLAPQAVATAAARI